MDITRRLENQTSISYLNQSWFQHSKLTTKHLWSRYKILHMNVMFPRCKHLPDHWNTKALVKSKNNGLSQVLCVILYQTGWLKERHGKVPFWSQYEKFHSNHNTRSFSAVTVRRVPLQSQCKRFLLCDILNSVCQLTGNLVRLCILLLDRAVGPAAPALHQLIGNLVLCVLYHVIGPAAPALRTLLDDAEDVRGGLFLRSVRIEARSQLLDRLTAETRQPRVEHQWHKTHDRLTVRSENKASGTQDSRLPCSKVSKYSISTVTKCPYTLDKQRWSVLWS